MMTHHDDPHHTHHVHHTHHTYHQAQLLTDQAAQTLFEHRLCPSTTNTESFIFRIFGLMDGGGSSTLYRHPERIVMPPPPENIGGAVTVASEWCHTVTGALYKCFASFFRFFNTNERKLEMKPSGGRQSGKKTSFDYMTRGSPDALSGIDAVWRMALQRSGVDEVKVGDVCCVWCLV